MTAVPKPSRPKREVMRKCKNPSCGARYPRREGAPLNEVWCSYPCAREILRIRQTAEIRKKNQEYDRETRRLKKKLKTPNKLYSEAMAAADKAACEYARIRDYELPCISCNRSVAEVEAGPYRAGGYWDGGHWKARSSHPHLRRVLWNINKQCKTCNGTSGARNSKQELKVEAGYATGMLAKWGRSEAPAYSPVQPSLEYLIRYAKVIRRKTRLLIKLRGYE